MSYATSTSVSVEKSEGEIKALLRRYGADQIGTAESADKADFWLKVDSLRKYGLLCGGPTINVDRCEAILRRGEAKGVFPTPMPKVTE